MGIGYMISTFNFRNTIDSGARPSLCETGLRETQKQNVLAPRSHHDIVLAKFTAHFPLMSTKLAHIREVFLSLHLSHIEKKVVNKIDIFNFTITRFYFDYGQS